MNSDFLKTNIIFLCVFLSDQLTSKKLTQCYLDRIAEVNKFTNSVVEINPLAIKEAEKIDDLIANTKDKSKLEKLPLLGRWICLFKFLNDF